MKVCNLCKQELSLSSFYKSSKNKDGLHSNCTICDNQRRADNYRKNKPRQQLSAKVRKQELKKKCMDYLGGACMVCGLVDHPSVFDFHHLDPSKKDFEICRFRTDFEGTLPELVKTILVCANCHRKIHSGVIEYEEAN